MVIVPIRRDEKRMATTPVKNVEVAEVPVTENKEKTEQRGSSKKE